MVLVELLVAELARLTLVRALIGLIVVVFTTKLIGYLVNPLRRFPGPVRSATPIRDAFSCCA
jgi:hypothetical protein